MKKVIPSRTKDVAAYAPAERVKGPAKIAWGVMELSVFDGLCCANPYWKVGWICYVPIIRKSHGLLFCSRFSNHWNGVGGGEQQITINHPMMDLKLWYVFFPFVDWLPYTVYV